MATFINGAGLCLCRFTSVASRITLLAVTSNVLLSSRTPHLHVVSYDTRAAGHAPHVITSSRHNTIFNHSTHASHTIATSLMQHNSTAPRLSSHIHQSNDQQHVAKSCCDAATDVHSSARQQTPCDRVLLLSCVGCGAQAADFGRRVWNCCFTGSCHHSIN